MPTIRLEFDVDSELYPELHAALSRLGSTRARGERMRQLAAAGLVWENVRIHGAAAIGPNAAPDAPVDASPRRSPAPGRAERSPPAERRSAARSRAATAAPSVAVDDRGDPHFVDLAIDAVPAPPASERRRARAAPRLGDYVERELPVLRDIVGEAAEAPDAEARPAWVDGPQPGPQAMAPGSDLPGRPAAEVDAADHEATSTVPADAATHLPALALKPASRSRLMRMKEKGLFKNG